MNFPALFSPLQDRSLPAPASGRDGALDADAGGKTEPRATGAERRILPQRATPGGLIIAEASPVTATGFGNAGAPGIYSEQQIKGWRAVVDAVHAKGGLIFLQLWHVGRVSHSSFQPGGVLPVAPSAVPIPRSDDDDRARQARAL